MYLIRLRPIKKDDTAIYQLHSFDTTIIIVIASEYRVACLWPALAGSTAHNTPVGQAGRPSS